MISTPPPAPESLGEPETPIPSPPRIPTVHYSGSSSTLAPAATETPTLLSALAHQDVANMSPDEQEEFIKEQIDVFQRQITRLLGNEAPQGAEDYLEKLIATLHQKMKVFLVRLQEANALRISLKDAENSNDTYTPSPWPQEQVGEFLKILQSEKFADRPAVRECLGLFINFSLGQRVTVSDLQKKSSDERKESCRRVLRETAEIPQRNRDLRPFQLHSERSNIRNSYHYYMTYEPETTNPSSPT